MQFDERDTPATTPTACPSPSPATTTGTAWTPASPAPRRRAWSQGSPGNARSQPQQPPGSQRPAEASRNQERASTRGHKARPAPSRGGEDARPAGSASPTQPREPGTPAPMQSQRPTKHQSQPHRLHQGSRRSGEGERGGEGRRERGSAQKITALQRRPAPAPDEATAQALHPCRQPSQHPRPDGQPWRAPSARGFNSAFVEYAELPLTNAAHAIPGEARQGGYFTF